MIKKPLLILSFIVCLVTAPFVYAQTEGLDAKTLEILKQFEAKISLENEKDKVGSITTGVIKNGKLIYTNSFGCADCEKDIPATPGHIYRTGSISKTMTSTLLAQLVVEGKVNLDDPVLKYMPEFGDIIDNNNWANDITLRHLANHTSGLDREPALEGAAQGPIAGWKEKIIASIPTTKINTEPGTKYSYSNIGYGILGLALERAAQEPFMDLIQRKLFDPLDMENTTFILSDEQMKMMSKGYQGNPNDDTFDSERPTSDHAGRGYKVPNGGAYTTASDLAKYMIALSGHGNVVNEEIITLIHEFPNGISMSPVNVQNVYGLGVAIELAEDNRVDVAGHGGSVAGYTAWMQYHPQSGNGILLLRNYNKGGGYFDIALSEITLKKLVSVTDN